jgi:hypothetical protein
MRLPRETIRTPLELVKCRCVIGGDSHDDPGCRAQLHVRAPDPARVGPKAHASRLTRAGIDAERQQLPRRDRLLPRRGNGVAVVGLRPQESRAASAPQRSCDSPGEPARRLGLEIEVELRLDQLELHQYKPIVVEVAIYPGICRLFGPGRREHSAGVVDEGRRRRSELSSSTKLALDSPVARGRSLENGVARRTGEADQGPFAIRRDRGD